jgi:hypothetical protein
VRATEYNGIKQKSCTRKKTLARKLKANAFISTEHAISQAILDMSFAWLAVLRDRK